MTERAREQRAIFSVMTLVRVPVVQLNAHCCYWYTSVLVTQESIASLRKAEQESKIISRLPTNYNGEENPVSEPIIKDINWGH